MDSYEGSVHSARTTSVVQPDLTDDDNIAFDNGNLLREDVDLDNDIAFSSI
jgi:hypothetical protein